MSGDHLALKEHNDLSEPSDDQSERVARTLSEWNPLGDDAESVPDLDGYRIEAADILFGLRLFGSNKEVVHMVRDVINQAFNLSLSVDECLDAAGRISAVLKTK